jgi:hypothetical protein
MKSRDIQYKTNNMLYPLQQYFAITIRDTVRKSLRCRFAPPSPTENLPTSLHTIYEEYLPKLNPAPNADRMCPSSSFLSPLCLKMASRSVARMPTSLGRCVGRECSAEWSPTDE